jgi:hypothetical protein
MDEHEDKEEPGRTVVDFTKTIDFFTEITLMAALCIVISLVFWTGNFSSLHYSRQTHHTRRKLREWAVSELKGVVDGSYLVNLYKI